MREVKLTLIKSTANYHVYSTGDSPLFPPNYNIYLSKNELGEVAPKNKTLQLI